MKVIRWLDNYLEEVLMTLLLIAIAVIMMVQVISRYVFGSALIWSDELARYMLLWCGFLSVSYCVKRGISIKIEQFQAKLSPRALPWLKMIRHTIVLVFCIIMIPFAYQYVRQAYQNGATSPAMRIPMYFMQSAPLVCFILLAIRVLQAWVREFRTSRKFMIQTLKEELKAELLAEMKAEELKRDQERAAAGMKPDDGHPDAEWAATLFAEPARAEAKKAEADADANATAAAAVTGAKAKSDAEGGKSGSGKGNRKKGGKKA